MLDLGALLGGSGGEMGGGSDPALVEALQKLIALEERRAPIDVAKVIRHEGQGIVLPPGMDLETAIRVLRRKMEEEERKTVMLATIPAQPYDGAIAFHVALKRRFGYVMHKPASMFGGGSASMTIQVDAYGGTVDVPLGEYQVPGVDGTFTAGFIEENGRVVFQIRADILGKYRDLFNEIVASTKEVLATASIYRGKAIKVSFVDEDGDVRAMPIITFIDVSKAQRPIFSRRLEEIFDYDVLAYVEHPDIIRQLEGSLKRGILLAGGYGLGKTMAANFIARTATMNGFTVIHATASEALAALQLAQMYEPSLVFIEDIDTATMQGRTEEVNALLNEISGLGRARDVIVLFTTNFLPKIDPALLRQGRTDAIFVIEAPDAEAAIRIARSYAGAFMDPAMDYSEVGTHIAGEIPAAIEEIVRRAKVRGRVQGYEILLPSHLIAAAESMKRERQALKPEAPVEPLTTFGEAIGKGFGQFFDAQYLLRMANNGNGHEPAPAKSDKSRTL